VRRGAGYVSSGPNPVTASAPTDLRPDLTGLVRGARRGLRRDVAALEAALDDAELFVPLMQSIEGAAEGEAIELDRSVEIVPHFLVDPEGLRYAALFTKPEHVEELADPLGWKTDGDELRVCTLPARIACELALSVIDETSVHGLVIDASQESELFLRRSELASVIAGHPVPLVGYVSELPPLEGEKVLVAEPAEPPPAVLVAALKACLADLPEVSMHRLLHTFNPERDLEPHLTLELTASASADQRAIAERVIGAIGEHVPPPGYIDIVFEDG
jgi:hypothetical protein